MNSSNLTSFKELTREQIEEFVINKTYRSNTPAYKKLTEEIYNRFGITTIGKFKKSIMKERRRFHSLPIYLMTLPQEAFDKRIYKHPADFVIENAFYKPSGNWALKEVIKICRETPGISLKKRVLYKKISIWIRETFHLKLSSFYKFFILKIPVIPPSFTKKNF